MDVDEGEFLRDVLARAGALTKEILNDKTLREPLLKGDLSPVTCTHPPSDVPHRKATIS